MTGRIQNSAQVRRLVSHQNAKKPLKTPLKHTKIHKIQKLKGGTQPAIIIGKVIVKVIVKVIGSEMLPS